MMFMENSKTTEIYLRHTIFNVLPGNDGADVDASIDAALAWADGAVSDSFDIRTEKGELL